MMIDFDFLYNNIKIMKYLLYLLIFNALIYSINAYRRIKDYNQYLQEWKKIVPQNNIHDVSYLALSQQQCYNKKCQFYYYQYKDQSFKDLVEQRTILLVSGMHGNQFLGPHTLLNAYKHLKAYRILYFPMANPSGFIKNQRNTYPSNLDPNRDYPVDSNTKCYQTSATRILDNIYRKYQIDFTIILHNGGTQIGFNWGTVFHQQNSHTVQYPINLKIAQLMQKLGGRNKRLTEFVIGTMVQTIYPAIGTFDDWAYAASKYPQIITSCLNYQYTKYPKNMTNGLVFLIQMGPFNNEEFGTQKGIELSPFSESKHNGHISRLIRILKQIMNIFKPKLAFKWSQQNQNIKLYVKGCSNGKIQGLRIQKYDMQTWFWKDLKNVNLQLQGNLRDKDPKLSIIQLNQQQKLRLGDRIRYKGVLHCDAQWIGIGTTFFSRKRIYQLSDEQQIKISNQLLQIDNKQLPLLDILNQHMLFDLNSTPILQYLIIAFLVFVVIYLLVKLKKKTSLNRKSQKFEDSQHVETEKNFQQSGEEQMGGDLHTARGGIIQM